MGLSRGAEGGLFTWRAAPLHAGRYWVDEQRIWVVVLDQPPQEAQQDQATDNRHADHCTQQPALRDCIKSRLQPSQQADWSHNILSFAE